jgi:hypothetical protein
LEHCPEVNIRYDAMFILEFPRPTYVMTNDSAEKTREKTRGETLLTNNGTETCLTRPR